MQFDIKKITVHHALDIYEIMLMVFKREKKLNPGKEHFWVLALNAASKIINLELVSLGSASATIVKPMEVLSIPLQKRAAGITLVHNHPSGSLAPSEADKDLTDRLIQACRLMNTPVLDHVIITAHSYFSFKTDGLLERLEASNKYVLPYELEKQYYEEMQAAIKKVEQESEKKVRESLKKGEEKGLKKGLKEGVQQEKLEIAKGMLSKGLDRQFIGEMTGLSEEKIKQLTK